MDTTKHTMACLFAQLGLANSEEAINRFINNHKGIAAEKYLAEADFWTPSQAEFLRSALREDADWSEVVEMLDARLR